MISNGFFHFILAVVIAAFCILPVQAQDSNSSTSDVTDMFYLCKRDKNTRWLRAFKLDNGKCQTSYSKEGYLQVISSASYFSMCEGVLHSVQKNLEEGGFKCTLTPKYSVIEFD
jgi:hypothetical protein